MSAGSGTASDALALCSGSSAFIWQPFLPDEANALVEISHEAPVAAVQWNQNNKVVVSAGAAGRLLLHYNGGGLMGQLPKDAGSTGGDMAAINSICFSRGSKLLAAGCQNARIHVWDLKRQACKHVHAEHKGAVTSVAYSPDDTYLGSASVSGEILFHLTQEGTCAFALPMASSRPKRSLHFSALESLLTGGADDGSLFVWDMQTLETRDTYAQQHKGPVSSVCFSPASPNILISAGHDQKVILLDRRIDNVVATVEVGAPVTSMGCKDDGGFLAAGTAGGVVVLYDPRKLTLPLRKLACPGGQLVNCLHWHHSGNAKLLRRSAAGASAFDPSSSGATPIAAPAPPQFRRAGASATLTPALQAAQEGMSRQPLASQPAYRRDAPEHAQLPTHTSTNAATLQAIQAMVDAGMQSMREEIRHLHMDVIRHFHEHQLEMTALVESVSSRQDGLTQQPLADLLADRFHCYGVDMPGQGDSEHADGNTIEHFAADVLNIVDTLKLEGCYALGHSSGGTTAMLAEQKRPGTFRALYCYEPVIYDPREPLGNAPLTTDRAAGCLAKLALKRRRRFLSQDAALQSFLARPPFTCFHPSAVHMYVEHGTRLLPDGSWELKCQPETEAQVYLDVAEVGQRIFERLANTRCPTVIAAGCDASKHTFSYLAQEAVRTASILPNGRLERFEGTNHFGPMHDPARLAQRIRINFQAAEEEARWNSLPKSVLLAQSKM
ncbi:hypothetical protein WJX72_004245 [[Myrmecia] bisecta]|uniref:Uncharacterized protein n=1 Tax=[Myrmecia] bisecta TaxID=41462 RepID=A0AAW1PH25_9CHLO